MDQTMLTGLAMVLGVLALIGAVIALLMGLRWLVFRIFPAFLVGPGGFFYDTTTRLGMFNDRSQTDAATFGTTFGGDGIGSGGGGCGD